MSSSGSTTTEFMALSVALGQAVLQYSGPAVPLRLVDATDKACAGMWIKEPVPTGSSVPQFDPTATVQGGVQETLPLASGSPTTLDFFYLRNRSSGTYLSALYTKPGNMAPAESSTLFTLGADATSPTDDGGLVCATITLAAEQGAQVNTLLVWQGADDIEPKALCMSSGTALRVYAFPIPCTSPNGSPANCKLAWQACNPSSGYCFDASLLSTSGAVQQPPAVPPLAFPNCTTRSLLAVTAVPVDDASTCRTPQQLKAQVAAHSSAVTASEQTENMRLKDALEVVEFVGIGLVLLAGVVAVLVIFLRHRRATVQVALQASGDVARLVHGSNTAPAQPQAPLTR